MDDLSKYLRIFRDEALEHVETIRRSLVSLEKEPGRKDLLAGILRSAHTLKGSSRMVGLTEIGNLSHKMEDVLKALEAGRATLTAELVNLLLESTDLVWKGIEGASAGKPLPPEIAETTARVAAALQALPAPAAKPASRAPEGSPPAGPGLLAELEGLFGPEGGAPGLPPAPANPPAGEPAPPRPPEAAEVGAAPRPSAPALSMETIRVDVRKLDGLTNLAGELVNSKGRVENVYNLFKNSLKDLQEGLSREAAGVSAEQLCERVRAKFRGEIRALLEEFFRVVKEMEGLVTEMQGATLDMRLLPVSTIFDAYPRTVRDLKQALGKEAALEVRGREILLDKRILEEVNPALIHLIRNAVDHGIEDPATRRRAGKAPEGRITLEAFNQGGNVAIRVSDDGAGIDPERLKRKAVEKRLITEEQAAALSDREARNLVFLYGFSTSSIITDLSGRGVGLNIVWEKVADLKGTIRLDSEKGRGTTVLLSFPPTYFTLKALLVRLGGESVAIPANFLREILLLEPRAVSVEGGAPVVEFEGRFIPLLDLRRFLGFPAREKPEGGPTTVVVVQFKDEFLGLRVDRVFRFEEKVIKSSGPFLRASPLISGVTILRYGEPCFILNIYNLFQLARGWKEAADGAERAERARDRRRVLVVDDSITTRILEKTILEKAGYEVTAASSGKEALARLDGAEFDLVVTDIEMPGLTGFELTEAIRRDLKHRDLPVVIVTSLARDEDRRRGIEAGAQAYIVKGTFEQTRLLETVRSLIG